jgi:hypothetical protein
MLSKGFAALLGVLRNRLSREGVEGREAGKSNQNRCSDAPSPPSIPSRDNGFLSAKKHTVFAFYFAR